MATKKNVETSIIETIRNGLRAAMLASLDDGTYCANVEIRWRTPMGVMMTCTNRHRLHVATIAAPGGGSIDISEAPAIAHYAPETLLAALPAKGSALVRVDKNGTVHVDRGNGSAMVHRRACEEFPAWPTMGPKWLVEEPDRTVGISPAYLADAAKGVALMMGTTFAGCLVTRGRLDPATLSAARDGNTFLALVMPMRIDIPRDFIPAEVTEIFNTAGTVVNVPVPVAAE